MFTIALFALRRSGPRAPGQAGPGACPSLDHESEPEGAGAVEIHRADGDAALIIDEAGNLRTERGNGGGGKRKHGKAPHEE